MVTRNVRCACLLSRREHALGYRCWLLSLAVQLWSWHMLILGKWFSEGMAGDLRLGTTKNPKCPCSCKKSRDQETRSH
jgi:hypothetical protein